MSEGLRHRDVASKGEGEKSVEQSDRGWVVQQDAGQEQAAVAERAAQTPQHQHQGARPMIMRRAVVPNADDIRLLLSAFYLKVDPARRSHWRLVADEFEARCTRATVDGVKDSRDPMRVIREMAMLNEQLRRKYGYDLTSVIPSPAEMKAMLAAFYQKHVPDRQHAWVQVAEEFAQRVAQGSPVGYAWYAESVLLEFIQLNQELRIKYGYNLYSVAKHWLRDHSDEPWKSSYISLGECACIMVALGIALVFAGWLYLGSLTAMADLVDSEGFMGMGRQKRGWGRSVQPHRVVVDVPLEVAYKGGQVPVMFKRHEVCEDCHGHGGHDHRRCRACGGTGYQIARTPFGRAQVTCSQCGGHGHIVAHTCETCRGKGTYVRDFKGNVTVPVGVYDGYEIVVSGEGHQKFQHDDGDLVVVVRLQKHKTFSRHGRVYDLKYEIKISLKEALLGFKREITHLDGNNLTVANITEVTRPDEEILMMNMGMPQLPEDVWDNFRAIQYGDLYIKVKVRLPSKLKAKTRERIEDILLWQI